MNTNARIDQIPTLEWSNIQDIHNEYPLIIYYPDKNKTKRFIKIQITPETRDILLQYRNQQKEIIETRKIAQEAQITNVKTNSMKIKSF